MKAMKAARASSDFSRSRKMLALLADAGDELVARAAHQVARDLQRLRRLGGDRLGGGQTRRARDRPRRRPRRSGPPPWRARPKSLRRGRAARRPAGGRGSPGTSRLEPASGTSPRSTKGVRNTVRGVAKVRSQCRLIVVPMPTAMPSTPETIGFLRPGPAPAGNPRPPRRRSPPVAIAMKSARSLPDENAPGTPRKTWTRIGRIGVAVGERGRHRRVHGAGQRVLLVRTVHADDLHGAAPLDE